MIKLEIDTPYITLQQALKLSGIIGSGGSAKAILQQNLVLVNDIPEQRRGRKLIPGDQVIVFDETLLIEKSNHEH
ncbi:MAG: RNA-binding S4 domain-containing protein [Acidibacillus sp.]|uniref:RNA-binding protein n=1 Tax=Sulfoacidibacillus ferrooxidans TaxID=2005001 RepID=A0A9X1V823_9BACL|nr:RNA-binding S4 domain-containing protein [Sulfoacidibacillus ferrooxidans]MCI0183276.1 hypothetical protein [Sulfoacidibacillus ferrooxidans]MCY0894046.1 RNA-binding S4 domain-containing protein [Acidibacillus sp.]